MRMMGVFDPESSSYSRRDRVLIRTQRGIEFGEILCESTPETIKWLVDPTSGTIIRKPTPNDDLQIQHLKTFESNALDTCAKLSAAKGLQMALVDAESLFGGERLVFYYLAEGRIDFRDLVKNLAREFQTRIEMKQIGVRDEAKLLADYGDCGKPVCCNSHLIVMPPVSMKMARMQKSSLDPNKISGRCGRLKCCLRFEQDVYDANQKDLPEVGSLVTTDKGKGKVLAQEILARKILVQFDDGRRISVLHSEVFGSSDI